MNAVFDQIIAFLTEQKSASLISQMLTLFGIPSLLIGTPVWFMTRRVRASVTQYDHVSQALNTARREAAALEKQNARLRGEAPAGFVAAHGAEMRDGNERRAMALAEGFLDRQREALLLAFRTRMDEAIGQSVEDGAPAFANARGWAMAALAIDPGDRMLMMLAEDLAGAEAAAASGARVKVMEETQRSARLDAYERLPGSVAALEDAWHTAHARGEYALCLFLARHGMSATARQPFGPGTRVHLRFRRHFVDSLGQVGEFSEALTGIREVVKGFTSGFGETDPDTLDSRVLMVWCQARTGDVAGAFAEVEVLLPLLTGVAGERHPDVLEARRLRADCIERIGDAAGAVAELRALLPLQTEVLGERHPDVLAARSQLAGCLETVGAADEALAEVRALLPLVTEARGARHPETLGVRHLLATCLERTGDTAGALAEVSALLPQVTQVLGGLHPDTLATRYLLAGCLQRSGDVAAALAEAQDLLPLVAQCSGEGHPDTLAVRIRCAECMVAAGDGEAAAEMVAGVRAALVRLEFRPEHRYSVRLRELEARLA